MVMSKVVARMYQWYVKSCMSGYMFKGECLRLYVQRYVKDGRGGSVNVSVVCQKLYVGRYVQGGMSKVVCPKVYPRW